MEEIRIPLSKKKILLALIGSVLFVAMGINMFTTATEFQRHSPLFIRIVSVITILFFGVCGIYAFVKLFDKKPGLIINEHGITTNAYSEKSSTIAWANIKGFEVKEINRTKLLLVFVNNPKEIIDAKKGIRKYFLQQTMNWYDTPVSISSTTLKCSFDKLHTTLLEYAAIYMGKK